MSDRPKYRPPTADEIAADLAAIGTPRAHRGTFDHMDWQRREAIENALLEASGLGLDLRDHGDRPTIVDVIVRHLEAIPPSLAHQAPRQRPRAAELAGHVIGGCRTTSAWLLLAGTVLSMLVLLRWLVHALQGGVS